MQTNKVTCDHCGKDLTTTGNCEGWRIVLQSEPIPSRGGMVTAMHVSPQFDRARHFCGLRCLGEWTKTEI